MMEERSRGTPGSSSRGGPGGFRPRLVVVLLILTATVSVFAVRIYLDTGYSRVERLARAGLMLYGSPGPEGESSPDPVDVEKRVAEWTGTKRLFPREGDRPVITSVRRERVGARGAAAVRFRESGNDYLLLVVRKGRTDASSGGEGLFSGAGFISGETEGKSFIYWEREGAAFFLVTSVDLTRAVEFVRRYFT